MGNIANQFRDDEGSRAFDALADVWAEYYVVDPFYQDRNDVLRRWLQKLHERHQFESGKVGLDVGCGTSPAAPIYKAAGVMYTGVDRSVEMLKNARRAGCNVVSSDVAQLPFATGAFDLAHMFNTIEFLPRPGEALRELVRVLKPGGHLLITVCNFESLFSRLYRLKAKWAPSSNRGANELPVVYGRYSARSSTALLQGAGFTSIGVFCYGLEPQVARLRWNRYAAVTRNRWLGASVYLSCKTPTG